MSCRKESTKAIQAHDLVEDFCWSEFGDASSVDTAGMLETRKGIVKYSNAGMKSAEDAGLFITDSLTLYYDSSPIYVVKSLKIKKVSITDNKATATVIYDRLARTEGHGDYRKLIPERVKNEKVMINLVYKDKWYIYDPPLPRISLDTMLAYYTPIIDDYRDAEPDIYQHYNKTYEVLKRLQEGK